MFKESLIPDVPEERMPHDVRHNLKNLTTTHHYISVSQNKSRPKDYSATSTGFRYDHVDPRAGNNPTVLLKSNTSNHSIFNYTQTNNQSKSPMGSIQQGSRDYSIGFNILEEVMPLQLQKHHSLQEAPRLQNKFNANLLNLMKQQMEIANKTLNARMVQQIRKNNDQLIRLEKRLKQNQSELQNKEREVLRLRELVEKYLTSSNGNNNINNNINNNKSLQSPNSKISLSKAKNFEESTSKNYEYLSSRIKDIEIKIRVLLDSQEEKKPYMTALLGKFELVRDQLLFIECVKSKNIQNKFLRFLGIQQLVLKNMEQQFQKIKMEAISMNSTSISSLNNAINFNKDQKIEALRKEFENTYKQVQNFSVKEFKYDNYELDQLKLEVSRLSKRFESFEKQKNLKIVQFNEAHKECQGLINSLRVISNTAAEKEAAKMVHETMTATHTSSYSKKQVIMQKLPTFGELNNHNHHNHHQHHNLEDYHQSDQEADQEQSEGEDIFFYPQKNSNTNNINNIKNNKNNHQQDSSFENFTEEDQEEDEQDDEQDDEEERLQNQQEQQKHLHFNQSPQNRKIRRLLQIIKGEKRTLPLHCEIDQTGYLKYKDTGIYIFDKEGNLFQLNSNEIDTLLSRKIIKISV